MKDVRPITMIGFVLGVCALFVVFSSPILGGVLGAVGVAVSLYSLWTAKDTP